MSKRKAEPVQPAARTSTHLKNIRTKVSGECDLFSTMTMRCPLCGTLVPANTPHSCKVLSE